VLLVVLSVPDAAETKALLFVGSVRWV